MKKRIMSMLLAAILLASSMDVTAFAETASTTDTEAAGGDKLYRDGDAGRV